MTYLDETIPANKGDPVQQFEIQQNMSELPLTKHPKGGVPIRLVILGGWGLMPGRTATPKPCCTPGGGCC